MTYYSIVASRSAADVSRLYVHARVAGLEVAHFDNWTCHTFEGTPAPGCELGVFRVVGTLMFYKDERRWAVRAASDANAVDLATLIQFGLDIVAKHGRYPGHWTRQRMFRHQLTEGTSKRIVWAEVAYRLDTDDLLAAAQTAVDVEELVTRVLQESQS